MFILSTNYGLNYRILSEINKGKKPNSLETDDEKIYYQRFFDLSLDLLCIADFQGYFRQINLTFAQTLGYSVDELISKPYVDFVHPDDREKTLEQVEKLAQGEKLIYFENRYCYADGTYHVLAWTAVPYLAENLIYGSARVISEQQQLTMTSNFDTLTQLSNRVLFLEQLKQVLEQSQNHFEHNFSVLFLELENFKIINDILGSLQGNELLINLVQRLKTCLKSNDIIARLSSDELSILLVEITSVQEVIQIVTNICQESAKPFIFNEQDILINLKIGIALKENEYTNAEAILRNADMAMNHAKKQGSQYAIFDKQMRQKALEQLQLEIELRQAIAKQEFVLYYQPIVSLIDHKITEFEALIRWQHPEKGLLLPDSFIVLAEQTGLIVLLGIWVIQEVCQQLQKWQKAYPNHANLKISINLSYQQLCAQNLVEHILKTFNQSQINPSCLKIEITESNLIENIEVARAILIDLSHSNIELCLDDFGTGYSSLSYLHQFPFNVVKIDRSFIVGQQTNNHYLEIVKAIITLAHALKMKVVAEGVETNTQFSQLTDLACDYGQGDFFAKPLSSQDAEKLLQDPQWH
ncbi:bifunctional diguanylate cyclase/phosphodiesterase [Chroococcus sp. FPU101]|uniref:putative bifunctional diguanylate cyclase/phosphodiesterase n=1 Tax=Chroococcus sp. FPU101 TaxID=1974212 RepID=UPI001A8E91BE|nr:EAL domain-containing protein [Chroococcus sp. FPU101]